MTHVPPFTPDSRLFPFTSRWYESRVGPVHYVDEGEGPPVLFLHGNPTWSFLYRGIIIRLRERFRCLALDLPGFGLSVRPGTYDYTPGEQAGIVRDFVRHLDLRDLTIMGQDWGGPIGLRTAVDEVGRLRALVMGNSWFWPIDSWQGKAFAYVMSMAPVQSRIIDHNLFIERLLPKGVKYPLSEEVLDQYREAMPTPRSRMGSAEMTMQLLASSEWFGDLERSIEQTLRNVPLLLTWGIHDPMFNRAAMDRFRDAFRSVRVERLDARHFIQEDAPGEIAAAIAAFLESTDRNGSTNPDA